MIRINPSKWVLSLVAWLALGTAPGRAESGVYLRVTKPGGAEAPRVIPLRIIPASQGEGPRGFPLTTGVPFADGQLSPKRLAHLRLLGPDGQPVPAQFSVRGSYPRSGNVRWLGVDFQLLPGAKAYRLELAGGPGPAHPTPVAVATQGDGFVVTTGNFKAEVPRRGGLLRRVWLGERLLLEQGKEDGNWLTTLEGARHADAGDKDVQAHLETQGPLHTVVRVEGRYVDAAGTPSCRWTARLHFYAGQPLIHIVHTFTWIGRGDRFKVRDLAVSFGLPLSATEAAADAADETHGESIRRPLKPGEMLALLQDQHWHLGHGDSHFGVLAGDPKQPQEIHTGKRAGSWVGASDGKHGVTLALRDLWQQFPKELRVEPRRLIAYLWSARGNAGPFDLSYDGLERFWGKAMVDQLSKPPAGDIYQRSRANPQSNDPTGMAKTHELLLVFHQGKADAAGAMAETFDAPPVALPDPHWTMQSDVVGRMWPKDAQRFPELERWIDAAWGDMFTVLDDWGDYGFFTYGDGPHGTYTFREGRAVASAWRYTVPAEYGLHLAAWLGWLRSGDRRFHDFAVAKTRFLNEVMMCHEDSPSRWKGSFSAGVPPVPWATGPGGQRASPAHRVALFEFFIQHALYHYYLSGDQRSLDVVREYADALRATITSEPNWARAFLATANNSLSRWYYQRIEELAVLYEHFGEPWFYEKSVELADLVIDLADSSGIAREKVYEKDPAGKWALGERAKYPTYIWYKAGHILSHMRNLEGQELEKAKQSFIKMAEHPFRTQSLETRALGLRMAYAYHFTKDPRYLAFARQRLEENRRAALLAPQGERKYTTPVSSCRYALLPTIHATYLMAALAEADLPKGPPVPMLFKQLPFPAVEFVFIKEADKPLQIELSAAGATFLGSDGQPLPEAWLGPATLYYPHSDSMAVLNTDQPLLYRTVAIPASAPAGEIRLRVARQGQAFVFASNARQAVMVAPEGFHVGGGFRVTPERQVSFGGGHDDVWHFLVPPDAQRFRVASSAVDRLVVRDPRDAVVKPVPAGKGWYEVAVSKETAGKLWSLRATAATDVAFTGIAPAFAYRNPDAHFVPAGVAIRKGSGSGEREPKSLHGKLAD